MSESAKPESVHNELVGDSHNLFQIGHMHGDITLPPSHIKSDGDQHTQELRHPWVKLAKEIWQFTEIDEANQFLLTVEEIAGRLYDRRQVLAGRLEEDDPWKDSGFAERMSGRLSALIGDLQDFLERSQTKKMMFEPLEVALLVLTPLAYQVWSLESAVALLDVVTTNPRPIVDIGDLRRSYDRFLSVPEQSRLVSRIKLTDRPNRGGLKARKAIEWWLFHRWVYSGQWRHIRQLDSVLHSIDFDENRDLAKVLTKTIKQFNLLFHLTPGKLRDKLSGRDLSSNASYPGIGRAQSVNERKIGILLVVAYHQAIELRSLPATFVEHVGIPRPADLDQSLTTISKANWDSEGGGVALVAHCHHEAVLKSLCDHVVRTAAVLAAVRTVVDEYNLEPLRHLPLTASTDKIKPIWEGALEDPVVEFRLDESRVRELLMGEQLYGDKSLAIRELYQNALDACRWRQARRKARTHPGDLLIEWTGQIRFFQSIEDDRHVLRCTDNGVGMGKSDLCEVFSRAGARFVDQPEFHEEEAKGVRFFPNSRFGIGVMSYFMLADEFEVRTRQMSKHGGTESGLRVWIAGPGHLFHIENLDESVPVEPSDGVREAVWVGTSVRLYLRDDSSALSCVEVLQEHLGMAEFLTSATENVYDDSQQGTWKPGEFRVRSPRMKSPSGDDPANILLYGDVEDDGQVAWCAGRGGLLVDGIHVGLPGKDSHTSGANQLTKINGAIVNLTGPAVPQLKLAVNRTTVQEDVTDTVVRLMTNAVPRLLQTPPPFFTYTWLCEVARATPAGADAITRAAVEADRELTTGIENSVVKIPMSTGGCFPPDQALVDRLSTSGRVAGDLDDHLLLWRLLAHNDKDKDALTGFEESVAASGIAPDNRPDVLPAWPTDELLVDWSDDPDTTPEPLPPGHVVSMAIRLQKEPADILNRLRVLGYDVGAYSNFPDLRSLHATDLTLLSCGLDGERPWLTPSEPVPLGHLIVAHRLIAAHLQTEKSVAEIVQRLKEFSLDIHFLKHWFVDEGQTVKNHDERLVSVNFNGKPPWLAHDNRDTNENTAGLEQIARAARKLDISSSAVVKRLKELHFDMAQFEQLPNWIDKIPVNKAYMLNEPLLGPDGTVAPGWIGYVALQWDITPHEAVRRLNDLPFELPSDDEVPDRFDEYDAALLRWLINRIPERNLRLSLDLLQQCAKEAGCRISTAADRLRAWGFTPPSDELIARDLKGLDEWLLRHITESWDVTQPSLHDTLMDIVTVAWRERERHEIHEIPGRLHELGYTDFVSEALSPDRHMPLVFVIAAAQKDNLSTRGLLEFVTELGVRVTPDGESYDWSDMVNPKLVEDLDLSKTVVVRDVILAALKHGLTIKEAYDRFTGLGLEVKGIAAELSKLLRRVPFKTKSALGGDS
jgi:hypothetical protein